MELHLLDPEGGKVFGLAGVDLDGVTERHFVGDLDPLRVACGDSAHEVLSTLQSDIVFRIRKGLPSQDTLDQAECLIETNRKAYLYWPHEGVLEVADPERIRSLRTHHRIVNLYWRWRRARQGREKRRQEKLVMKAARKAPPVPRGSLAAPFAAAEPNPAFEFLTRQNEELLAQGRGLYIRLDYWARITGGGSYGHTCYQAKALAGASTEGLYAVMASPFPLLDDLSIPQIVLPPQTPLADEYALVENGRAYADLVRALLETYRPAYVFERLVLGNDVVSKACKARDIPYIAEFNGSELTMSRIFGGREMANADTLQAIETGNFERADVISVVSEPVKDEVVALGIPPEKIIVNPNGVDLDAYAPLAPDARGALRAELGFDPDDVVVGFCGTFGGWHGVEVLADAIPQIAERNTRTKFLLIGDGNFKTLVDDAVAAAEIEDRIVDKGMVPQQAAARLLAACDIFLSPHSRNMGDRPFFGSPTKLFEYMAYGVGIVCSDLVQLGEVMRPAVTLADRGDTTRDDARAVLVEPGSVDELVEATLWLAEDAALRRKLGKNARIAARDHYTWDVHVQSLLHYLRGEPAQQGYAIDRSVT